MVKWSCVCARARLSSKLPAAARLAQYEERTIVDVIESDKAVHKVCGNHDVMIMCDVYVFMSLIATLSRSKSNRPGSKGMWQMSLREVLPERRSYCPLPHFASVSLFFKLLWLSSQLCVARQKWRRCPQRRQKSNMSAKTRWNC